MLKFYFTCPVCDSHHSFTVDTSKMSAASMNWREYCNDNDCYGSVDYYIEKEDDGIDVKRG